MVDADIALDGVVGLTVPDAGGLIKVQAVPQGQLPESAPLHRVGVVDDNFYPDVFTVLVAFREDGPDVFPVHIVLVHHTGLMGEDDRLAFVAGKAGLVKNIFGETELPADSAVRVHILEDAD